MGGIAILVFAAVAAVVWLLIRFAGKKFFIVVVVLATLILSSGTAETFRNGNYFLGMFLAAMTFLLLVIMVNLLRAAFGGSGATGHAQAEGGNRSAKKRVRKGRKRRKPSN